MVLRHNTGLPNWRFFSADRKLKFQNTPGEQYEYSGEGFEYLAKFAEKKLNTPFVELAKKHVFEPAGLSSISLSVNEDFYSRIARELDAEVKFYGHYCSPYGYCSEKDSVSVAGNMVVTVGDYSKFLIWAMDANGLNNQLQAEIQDISIQQPLIQGFDCAKLPKAICPSNQGYGLGWNITEFEGGKAIGHGGSDWSLISLAYFYPKSRDGVVIFINGPNASALKAMLKAISLLDPDSPKLHEYQFRIDRN